MKIASFFAVLALTVQFLPAKAGQNFDQCITQTGSNQEMMKKFSSYNNLTSFCKCFDYVISTSLTEEQKQMGGYMVIMTGQMTPELVRATYQAKSKCSPYMR